MLKQNIFDNFRILTPALLIIYFACFDYLTVQAETVSAGNAQFETQLQSVDGTPLYLNGIGYRRVTLLRIKAYAAALYVPAISNNPSAILDDLRERRLVITFFYDVDKVEVQEALEEHFIDNNPNSSFLPLLKQVLPNIPDIKEDDTLTLFFNRSGITLDINNKTVASNPNIEFGREILRIWLGDEPPNESLKEGLLELEL